MLVPLLIEAAAKAMKSQGKTEPNETDATELARANVADSAKQQLGPGPIMTAAAQPNHPSTALQAQPLIASAPAAAQNGQNADSYEQLRRLRGGF